MYLPVLASVRGVLGSPGLNSSDCPGLPGLS